MKNILFLLLTLNVHHILAQDAALEAISFDKGNFTFSAAVGTQSLLHHRKDKLDGTNKVFLEDVSWTPFSLKMEYNSSDYKFLTIALTVNNMNERQVYNALWKEQRSEKIVPHKFTVIDSRLSFIFRFNRYIVRNPNFELFWGAGLGLAIYNQVKDVSPAHYEYGGTGETSFLQVIGLETSMGIRIYPFKKKVIGFMLEGGLMQSFAQLGLSYRLIKN